MNSKLSSVTDLVSPQSLLVGAAAVAVSAYTVRRIWKSRHLPPGPIGLPLLGRLPWIDVDHIEESEEKMRQKYGGIYSYYAGQRLMIVVSSYEMLNDMLKQDIFSGRMAPPYVVRSANGCGIALNEGKPWSDQRNLCLRVLHAYCVANNNASDVINDEIDQIFSSLKENPKGRDVNQLFRCMSNSVIASFVLGKLYAHEDPRFNQLVEAVVDFFSAGLSNSVSLLFPTFEPIIEIFSGRKSRKAESLLTKFIEQEVAERESELTDPDAESLCLVDAYVQERRKAEAKGDFVKYKPFHLIRSALELFLGGTDSTARSIQWLLLYMTVNPDVQERVHREIIDVVGPERRPQMSDKTQLHYTQAVIDESMRFANLSFNGVPHRAMKDATFRGFRIPSDAAIVPFVAGVHRDAAVWTRPNEFYPEHFLDSEGHYSPSKYLIPFLIGKRSCPGDGLARREIFLAFTAVMQRFSVKLPERERERLPEILRGFCATARLPIDHELDFEIR